MNSTLERIREYKFLDLIEIDEVCLPVFIDNEEHKVIVGLKKHWELLEKYCIDSDYQYFIFHPEDK